jgi:hypothetical protein
LVAAGFLAAGFFAAVLAAAGFAVVAGLASAFAAAGLAAAFFVVASLTPASLAIFESCALRREAVFFSRTFFLTAVSRALCAADRVAALGAALNALIASRKSRFVTMLRSRRLIVCFARLIADLIIGMNFFLLLLYSLTKWYVYSRGDYRVKPTKSKGYGYFC